MRSAKISPPTLIEDLTAFADVDFMAAANNADACLVLNQNPIHVSIKNGIPRFPLTSAVQVADKSEWYIAKRSFGKSYKTPRSTACWYQ